MIISCLIDIKAGSGGAPFFYTAVSKGSVLMVEQSLLAMIQAEMRFSSQSLNKSRLYFNRE